MEEQQVLDFVRRVSQDENLRREVLDAPENVIAREGFSPRVGRIVMRLAPHLSFERQTNPLLSGWWL